MIYTFSYQDWSARYPVLAASVSEPTATLYFAEAEIYCDNSACAIIPYEPDCAPPVITRELILNSLVAHIALLNSAINGIGPSPLVGRVDAATQGSVSVSAKMDGVPGTAAWFMQTQPGASAYQMMAGFRNARYIANPGRFAFVGAPRPFGYPGYGGIRGRW